MRPVTSCIATTYKNRTGQEVSHSDPHVGGLEKPLACSHGILHPKIAVAYTKIVTISTDNILESNEFRAAVGAQWPFLSDSGRKVQQDLDIQEYTDPHHNPMILHTFVLEPGLVIHKIYNGYWFWGRPSTENLHEVTRKIRPDWDLSAPGLRENWEGDKKLH